MKVIDASVGVKWVVDEPDSPQATALQGDDLHAPDIWPTEVANAIVIAEQRGRITNGDQLLADALLYAPTLHAARPLLARAHQKATQFRRSLYDCLYVVLAEREGCELITADKKLVNSLQSRFPFVRLLT